jgi:hypothetical protein
MKSVQCVCDSVLLFLAFLNGVVLLCLMGPCCTSGDVAGASDVILFCSNLVFA